MSSRGSCNSADHSARAAGACSGFSLAEDDYVTQKGAGVPAEIEQAFRIVGRPAIQQPSRPRLSSSGNYRILLARECFWRAPMRRRFSLTAVSWFVFLAIAT